MKIPGDRDWARQWSSLQCGPILGSEEQTNYPADEHSSLLDVKAFQNRPAQQRQLHTVSTCGVPLKCPQMAGILKLSYQKVYEKTKWETLSLFLPGIWGSFRHKSLFSPCDSTASQFRSFSEFWLLKCYLFLLALPSPSFSLWFITKLLAIVSPNTLSKSQVLLMKSLSPEKGCNRD